VLAEWESAGPETTAALRDLVLGTDAAVTHACDPLRSRLDVRQERSGVRIETTSFVGRVQIGPLRIAIRPKLAPEPLSRLLRYAYGIDDLALKDVLPAPLLRFGLHDLLIAMLVQEVELLLRLGLTRRYMRSAADLALPRGRIDVGAIAARGGVREPRLPCVFHDRDLDWGLNRTVRAGLGLAAWMATPGPLARHAARLEGSFAASVSSLPLTLTGVERAEAKLTRLTAAYAPSLTLIRLLCGADGLSLEQAARDAPVSGFLFDMNRFFQHLLSRFLRENLPDGQVVDERVIRDMLVYDPAANPRGVRNPRLRPDYAIFEGQKLTLFADAKYRDVWTKGTSAGWLYQLQAYAWAAPAAASLMLYASTEATAREERIIVRDPLRANRPASSIVLRPVHLQHLDNVIAGGGHLFNEAAKRLAKQLVWGAGAAPASRAVMS
jgi:5-methylcytosine-specific restriction enzyme subunit McrC